MSLVLSPAQKLLLECCANSDRNLSQQMATLDRSGETELVNLALQTRTAGLLHRASDGLRSGLKDQLSMLARHYSLHNLQVAQVLVEAVDRLSEAGLRPIALKGVSLAFDVYPDAWLRPLRDLDLLLKPTHAEAAQKLLLSRPEFEYAAKSGRYGLEHSHQLPEIVHVPSGVIVEIHHRLNAKGWAQEQDLLQMVFEKAVPLELLGREILVPSPEANFLHLLGHATLHHAFANGPLVLSDLHYLVKDQQVIARDVQVHADALGLANALGLVSQAACNLGASWPERTGKMESSQELANSACAAMLMTEDQIAQHDQTRRLEQMDGNYFARVLRSIRPDPYELAKHSNRAVDDPLNWLGYPSWFVEKGARFSRGSNEQGVAEKFRSRDELIDWLSGDVADG